MAHDSITPATVATPGWGSIVKEDFPKYNPPVGVQVIRRALELVGCDRSTGQIVPWTEVEGMEVGTKNSTHFQSRYQLASDGELGTRPKWWSWRSASDPELSIGELEEVTKWPVTATYVIHLYESWSGVGAEKWITVAITPHADRTKVARAVLTLVKELGELGTSEWKEGLNPENFS